MTVQAIFAPVFAQVMLTFALLVWMGRERWVAVRAGAVKGQKGVSPRRIEWPARAQQVSDCYLNQFELPLLFYVAVGLGFLTRSADLVFVTLSWVFVATRYVHAFVHTGSNRTATRFGWFLVGALILMAMWIWLAARIYAPV
ncbi:MAPEG family protein [Hansschlegelia zhihuaiae]|uniref:MAPEG family protein n=1 Tax=Hansschlegelia zhihuaiae TaxID=405005 RepID=A0A4Q0M2T1_9HYPH|nr:MAPEG family protein [Hansschlegelia zhihuaiae]RXF67095.1 MAPEG family protein [Hansschlegelia zhihuaiae]